MIRTVLTDIEGTTSSIRFVHDVLFPYSRERLGGWLAQNAQRPEVAEQLAEIRRIAGAPNADVGELTRVLQQWIAEDRKLGPLKVLQGLIWEEGYREGALRSHVYPDAVANLRRWRERGLDLCVYSSGSIHAQQLLFGHTEAGDLSGLLSGWFDTTSGPKKERASYEQIARALGKPPREILFLSDVRAEIDAARAAGMKTTWLVREGPLPADTGGHPVARSFDEVQLPEAP